MVQRKAGCEFSNMNDLIWLLDLQGHLTMCLVLAKVCQRQNHMMLSLPLLMSDTIYWLNLKQGWQERILEKSNYMAVVFCETLCKSSMAAEALLSLSQGNLALSSHFRFTLQSQLYTIMGSTRFDWLHSASGVNHGLSLIVDGSKQLHFASASAFPLREGRGTQGMGTL